MVIKMVEINPTVVESNWISEVQMVSVPLNPTPAHTNPNKDWPKLIRKYEQAGVIRGVLTSELKANEYFESEQSALDSEKKNHNNMILTWI
jgi:hypothetical protein